MGKGGRERNIMSNLIDIGPCDVRGIYLTLLQFSENSLYGWFHFVLVLHHSMLYHSSPFLFSSPPPPFLPPSSLSSPHRRPHLSVLLLIYSPLFLHQLVQVSTHDMFSLQVSHYLLPPCCSTLQKYTPNNASSTHACFCAKVLVQGWENENLKTYVSRQERVICVSPFEVFASDQGFRGGHDHLERR